MTDRHTADTITSDALDALYDERDRLTAELDDYDQRVQQVEDLLRIAHDTSNQSEAERARQHERAERAIRRATEEYDRRQVAEAAIERVRERCQAVRDRVGPGGMINASQILGLLSPTWPDGNYEAPGPAATEATD